MLASSVLLLLFDTGDIASGFIANIVFVADTLFPAELIIVATAGEVFGVENADVALLLGLATDPTIFHGTFGDISGDILAKLNRCCFLVSILVLWPPDVVAEASTPPCTNQLEASSWSVSSSISTMVLWTVSEASSSSSASISSVRRMLSSGRKVLVIRGVQLSRTSCATPLMPIGERVTVGISCMESVCRLSPICPHCSKIVDLEI
mmetsp:Transcript_6241/g.10823  ORF Transcript_6241/g.10823 Transcript_6241/m.10823 type:complete len:207 (-) Transcript_6241:35-655(-)